MTYLGLGLKVTGAVITINGMLNKDMESILGGFALMYLGNTFQQNDLHHTGNESLRDIATQANDIEYSIDEIKTSLQQIVDKNDKNITR